MIRFNRLTDHSLHILKFLASQEQNVSAKLVSQEVRLPTGVTSKLLKLLQKANLLTSSLGAKGGYLLNKPAHEIKLSEVINTIENGIRLMPCCDHKHTCKNGAHCDMNHNMQALNRTITSLFNEISIDDLNKNLKFSIKITPETAHEQRN